MSDLDMINELRAALGNATPGPWVPDDCQYSYTINCPSLQWRTMAEFYIASNNRDLVVAMHKNLPLLLDLAEKALRVLP